MMKSVIVCTLVLMVLLAAWSFPTLAQSPASSTQITLKTPTPSFDPAIRENFLDLLKIDPDCLFPCWQGLKLGESSIEGAEQLGYKIFAQRGKYGQINQADLYYPYDAYYSFEYSRGIVADGIVVVLDVRANDEIFSGLWLWYLGFDTSTDTQTLPNEYLIKNVVEAYGLPDKIWLMGSPRIIITFVYSEKGFLIEYGYVLSQGTYDLSVRVICPDTFGSFAITAYIPGDFDPSHFYEGFGQLDATTAISADEFIDLVMERDTDTDCVETPESIWPDP